ncbi:thioesterase family protein [Corticibacterium sp. UT-5YL-CI-8]|nr:thioesterase family protein [Tianweitania sp. UT-5YL-CI-8]
MTALPAPYISPPMTVEDAWIDYNGHLNMAYYHVLFDRSVDYLFEALGLGEAYREKRGGTTYAAEVHVCYVRELHRGATVVVSNQVIDHDAKRLHVYQELRHAEGWLAATSESLTLHVDTSGPKVVPFPTDILKKIAAMQNAHAVLPKPDRIGRAVGIPRRSS